MKSLLTFVWCWYHIGPIVWSYERTDGSSAGVALFWSVMAAILFPILFVTLRLEGEKTLLTEIRRDVLIHLGR